MTDTDVNIVFNVCSDLKRTIGGIGKGNGCLRYITGCGGREQTGGSGVPEVEFKACPKPD